MRKLSALVTGGLLAAALATAASLEEMDANGDGMVTFDELLAVLPYITEDRFRLADTNGDGIIDAEELADAQETGLLPET